MIFLAQAFGATDPRSWAWTARSSSRRTRSSRGAAHQLQLPDPRSSLPRPRLRVRRSRRRVARREPRRLSARQDRGALVGQRRAPAGRRVAAGLVAASLRAVAARLVDAAGAPRLRRAAGGRQRVERVGGGGIPRAGRPLRGGVSECNCSGAVRSAAGRQAEGATGRPRRSPAWRADHRSPHRRDTVQNQFGCEVAWLLLGGGAMVPEYEQLGRVRVADDPGGPRGGGR